MDCKYLLHRASLLARNYVCINVLTPQRVDKIFRTMDLNKDHQLTFEEFKEGSKHDPTIVQVSAPCSALAVLLAGGDRNRR